LKIRSLIRPKVRKWSPVPTRDQTLHLEVLSGRSQARGVAERVQQLATDGTADAHLLDYEDLLFRSGNVEESLEAQINRAAPNWKIDPAYPMMNNIVEASAFGHYINSRTGQLLAHLGLTYMEPSNTCDPDQLIVFRAHGVSLRGPSASGIIRSSTYRKGWKNAPVFTSIARCRFSHRAAG
jgi:hypothetical protein